MKKDFGKLRYKLNQLKKRLKRSKDNPSHSDELKDTIRLKRVKELQKELKKNGKWVERLARGNPSYGIGYLWVKTSTTNLSGCASTTSKDCVPIDPVEPNIAIFFFI